MDFKNKQLFNYFNAHKPIWRPKAFSITFVDTKAYI